MLDQTYFWLFPLILKEIYRVTVAPELVIGRLGWSKVVQAAIF